MATNSKQQQSMHSTMLSNYQACTHQDKACLPHLITGLPQSDQQQDIQHIIALALSTFIVGNTHIT